MKFWQSLKNLKLSLNSYLAVASCWLGLALNYRLFEHLSELSAFQGIWLYLFNLGMGFLLIGYMYLCLTLLLWHWNAKWLLGIILIIASLSSYFCNSLGIGIDALQLQNALQTNHSEAFDLLSPDFALWLILLVILPVALFSLIQIKKTSFKNLIVSKMLSILLILSCSAVIIFSYYLELSSIFRGHRELRNFISPQNTIHAIWSYHKKLSHQSKGPIANYGTDASHNTNYTAKHPPKLMVLVVGETARAESFSLNGYSKNTNPELSQLPIINFQHVTSCGTETAVSVPCMFSGMPRLNYDERTAYTRENLLDVLKRAGYHVTWIDNDSGCKDVCDRVHNYVIPTALQQKYCQDGECLDQILVESLQLYLKQIPIDDQQPQIIVLHQIGSHGPAYYKRTPANFQHFQPICNTNNIQDCSRESLINVYDNTIIYTDHVLASIIHVLENDPHHYQSMLWYLSDHGESTGEHGLYLHGAPYFMAPNQQTHIPMIMWLSQRWKTNNPDHENCLNRQTQQALSQDNLFPTLLSLLDVDSHIKNPTLDMLQQCQQHP
ncbi:phosphoethanolamine--lipid A transferase [Acinetobacter qingfengensis]|uniref:Lipid A phosphoethanolamine transferase n=1 Tax=Acinetobacter qingfengensis TaxID=1262585 RepID=A0A1E7RFX0_9GAMM|nr:phosphoethanolamine--lipid A transferase [Acinetobacter qingfengensis]KAA8732691.1 phosphoethanolamine--lipid A transferase [Acinetobacter qingfengensis]OEY98196.1 lipid A phosphoethanolamine transferase [Acinetobacter qingfengensis]